MSCPKGAVKWQRLSPKVGFLLLTLFTQLSQEEAKQHSAGKEDLFCISGPRPGFCWPAPGVIT